MPTDGACFSPLQDYRNSLDLACETGRNAEFGWVNWTVAEDTPDLVYYQVLE